MVMETLVSRAEGMLSRAGRPMRAKELARLLRADVKAVRCAVENVAKKHGAALVKIRAGHEVEYLLKKTSRFPLPADLWRGWVNPATGIVPAHLGV